MGIKHAAPRNEADDLAEPLSWTENSASGGFVSRPWRKIEDLITSRIRMRFWLEAGLAALCGLLGILTLFTRDWIEALTGFDPDNHDGSFEWAIVAALFLICIVLSVAARADWRRLSALTSAET